MELERRRRRRRQQSPMPTAAAAATAASVSLVLGSDDLLSEILLRLGFPAFLVHAALACKRWLRVASDPAFLRRFRARHPPRLLGFYAKDGDSPPKFWPVRHPPELASAVARAGSVLDGFPGHSTDIVDCRDNRLLLNFSDEDGYHIHVGLVLSPLQYPAGGTVILKPPPAGRSGYPRCYSSHTMAVAYRSIQFLSDNGRDGLQCFELEHKHYRKDNQTTLKVSVFQDGAWRTRTSLTTGLPDSKLISNVLLMGPKLYMATDSSIFLLDLESASFSVIRLPEKGFMFHTSWLLKADDSRVYVMTVREDQLCFWNVSGSVGNWVLVDTVYLRKIFANLGMTVGFFKVACVGDNAEFVLLEMGGRIFYINIPCQTIEEVVQRISFGAVCPLMMIWPPSFPKVKEGYDQNE